MEFFINKKLRGFKLLFLTIVVSAFCFNAQTSFAKEYYYKNFEVNIKINQDSTFDVTEKQIYYLDGSFGFFNRDISLNKIDAITDVEVFDGNGDRIPKNELQIKSRMGEKHVQWNFPRRNFNKEGKAWIVKYKVHGGISFLKNYDEIYWNAIPQDRDVTIKNVKVTVSLPDNEKFRGDLIQLYAEDISDLIKEYLADEQYIITDNNSSSVNVSYDRRLINHLLSKGMSFGGYYFNRSNTQAIFWGKNLKPNTNFTIAVGFPKEIIPQSAYWKDFLKIYYGYILSIIIFLSCVIIGFIYWHKTERSKEGKRAIIPQYEPPQNLKPAMAEIIVKEKLTSRGLSATIIDLAVREYVKIEEVSKTKFEHITKNIPLIIIGSLVIVIIVSTVSPKIPVSNSYYNLVYILFPFVGLMIMYIFALFITTPIENKNRDYKVIKVKPYENNSDLEDYEKKYLEALFGHKEYFSTKELKKSQTKARALYKEIQKVKDKIYEETELNTGAFERGLTIEKKKNIIFGILFFVVFFMIFIVIGELGIGVSQFFILALTVIISVIGLWAFIKYEARLSREGIKLKEDWLGFKMYLETAERYRMQNLKPEFFEKYLPYAIIFGVEKKWAKAFESLNMPSPSWYAGSAYAAGASSPSNLTNSFSPSAFSASFTSSFTSAFSSSGASGASGGGGGAGGGGGGGGGGAG